MWKLLVILLIAAKNKKVIKTYMQWFMITVQLTTLRWLDEAFEKGWQHLQLTEGKREILIFKLTFFHCRWETSGLNENGGLSEVVDELMH